MRLTNLPVDWRVCYLFTKVDVLVKSLLLSLRVLLFYLLEATGWFDSKYIHNGFTMHAFKEQQMDTHGNKNQIHIITKRTNYHKLPNHHAHAWPPGLETRALEPCETACHSPTITFESEDAEQPSK